MTPNNYAPKRRLRELTRRKLFVLAVEGRKTEKEYFALFMQKGSLVKVECLPSGSNSSPNKVLQRMEARLLREDLEQSDEAWLVVDQDGWQDQQLARLHDWTKKSSNYALAVSNPKFEYWLLLHFEDGSGVTTARDCDVRLKKYLPNYDKGIDSNKFTRTRIDQAILRAASRDEGENWPSKPGSTVYRLVHNILNAQKSVEACLPSTV